MKFVQNHIPGCYEIELPMYSDQRGKFIKTTSRSKFAEHGLETSFVETFFTVSAARVLRGMHFQLPPADHAKLVYCSAGRILDVCLDLRVDSPTFGRFSTVELSSEKNNAVYMPTGIAHGFYVLEAPAVTVYHVTTEHNPACDTGIAWNSFGMNWPDANPMISKRDSSWPKFGDFKSPFSYGNLAVTGISREQK